MSLRIAVQVLLMFGFCVSIPAWAASAEEVATVKLEWRPRDAGFAWYMPLRISLGTTKPGEVKRIPDDVTSAVYGIVSLGPQESPQKFVLLIDEPEGKPQRLWADGNGNGDLTDDPPARWEHRGEGRTEYSGSATFQVAYGDQKRDFELMLYRFNKSQREDARTSLFGSRSWAWTGQITLAGKTYRAALDDALSTGDFRGKREGKSSGVFLVVDVNSNGRLELNGERFDVRKPFNIGGASYEIADLTASGDGFRIVASDEAVPETKPNATIAVGSPAPKFTAKTLDGKPVKFPDDFQGRVVMLDFWATWCGPCRKELPNLKSVYEEFHSQGFDVLGISLDESDAVEKLGEFVNKNGMTWPNVCDGKGWETDVAALYGVHGIPAGFIVSGKSGQIVALGPDARGEQLRTSVAAALAGKPIQPSEPLAKAPPKAAEPGGKGQSEERSMIDPLLEKAAAAAKAGRLLSYARFLEKRAAPEPLRVHLPEPSTKPLRGRDVAQQARDARIRVGIYYRCTKGDHWHLKLNCAYAVASDSVATAWHVLKQPATFQEGFVVAVNNADEIVPITAVIAADERMDAIVLRVAADNLEPRPLSRNVEVGDSVFCLSDPFGQRNYFSSGIVNRFHAAGNGKKTPTTTDPSALRVTVSTDWAPGAAGRPCWTSAATSLATWRPLPC